MNTEWWKTAHNWGSLSGSQNGSESVSEQSGVHGFDHMLSKGTVSEEHLVVWIELHDLFTFHVVHCPVITHRLALHDTLHVGTPALLRCHQYAWRVCETCRHGCLADLASQLLLDEFHNRLQHSNIL